MEPVTLAALTGAATTLGVKVIEGFGGEAGKSLWSKVKNALGWTDDPAKEDLPVELAERFLADGAVAKRVVELLKDDQAAEAGVRQLVGRIDAKNVNIIQNNYGGIHQS
ncbi:MAG: hypothetical protein AAGI46_03580 [Planctomycetota bacterium]